MITATQTNLTIELFIGNMICGSDQATLDTINLDASVDAFKAQVAASLPEYKITWNTIHAEGGQGKITGIEEDEAHSVRDQMGKIFDDGAFWITK
jgi:hypothetical protein